MTAVCREELIVSVFAYYGRGRPQNDWKGQANAKMGLRARAWGLPSGTIT